MWPVHSQCVYERKPIKIFKENGAWAYPGTFQFFGYYYFTATILTEANAAVNFDTYRTLQRHRAVSLPQQAVLVGLCLQTAVNYLSKSDKY